MLENQIKKLIKQKGYSQKYVAKEIGLSYSRFNAILNTNIKELSKSKQYRLYHLLDIPISDLK